ncbi:MAG: di-trans,poly-cis-decaprenylcistransferase [Leptotrichiaceae bacterium]|nr:di-trans,poly-cis-decaprenylcistransferase [Leptotrichiaceae bacterium]MBP6281090.1 di-trans,poly-cis-decaprenylcistransferase [Leptotrichiaceae bacterium]MBP7100951.1 di-trans,poly-cis-decaprenylcistransferase [Leptotrichiaceae bacterium]MBP7725514.1 di-trans,poly-cis-decaprenylcistransferase [Leptotrichiaceae bacterium]MBP9630140.1 di-trans,poly-cis-decaprenylcistransferase [Leptotrichiaceae bacterium]
MDLIIPHHVAIIMDGNGRWAEKKGKIRLEGHRKGVENLERILEHCINRGVKYLTAYAFSTENWKRPEKEVNGLMELFSKFLDSKRKKLKKQGIKLLVTGSKEGISSKLLKKIEETEKFLENESKLIFNIAFNYGGRREIIDAVIGLINEREKLGKTENVTEEEFIKHLYRPEIPDPELIIRTSGEFRISNFLLWEVAYSEFYVTDVYWPDFDEEEFDNAILSFNKRDRRYGGLNVK